MENNKENDIINSGIAGASYETIQRYGAAVKEHLVAYSGVDNEKINPATGQSVELKKCLKGISAQQKNSNPEYEFQIRQQNAGWAAEVKDTAKTNAENIINGNPTRKIRHDDLPNTPANDPLFDHVEIDADGNVIEYSGTQMKFIGAAKDDPTGAGNAERALEKLKSKKFQKYIDNDVKIEVPKDEYKQMVDKASVEIEKLEEQIKKVKDEGNEEAVNKIKKKIEDLEKLKKNIRPSKLTRKESLEAVDSPVFSTAKSVADISHKAGINTSKISAAIGGSASLVRNVVGVYKGEIEANDATKNVIKDTTESAAMGYATGFTGSAIKGIMQNSSSEYTRALSKTNLAGTIVQATVAASKTLRKYFCGQIDGLQCLEELGEQGTGMIASSMFAAIGKFAVKGSTQAVLGGLVGGMVGYALASASYKILIDSLNHAKLSHEERENTEKACKEHIKLIREYRAQIEFISNNYLIDSMNAFNESFSGIKNALAIDDIDWFIDSTNEIIEQFGGKKAFSNMNEFDSMMLSGESFKM